MKANTPEKQYFDRALAIEEEIAERKADLKAVYEEAKRDPYEIEIPLLRAAVKHAMKTDDQILRAQRKAERLEELLHRLGQLQDTPLGKAAVAAQ